MSGPTSRLSIDPATLQNIRVVWPPKEYHPPLSESDNALRALHRIRRQLQVYENTKSRGGKRMQLTAAGLTVAVAFGSLPLTGLLGSRSSQASSDPGIQIEAGGPAPLSAPGYSLSAPIDSEALQVQRPALRAPLAVEFEQALNYVAEITPFSPASGSDAAEAALAADSTPPSSAAAHLDAPVRSADEISDSVTASIRPNPAFNSQRHESSTYVAPPPPPAPVRSAGGGATPVYRGYIRDLIYRYFPASQAAFATRVAYCESGFNPNAVGDQGRARGIFQFWRATFLETRVGAANGWDAAFNAEVNIRAAAEKVARDGWSAWTCARKV